jgi:hypothetical protein
MRKWADEEPTKEEPKPPHCSVTMIGKSGQRYHSKVDGNETEVVLMMARLKNRVFIAVEILGEPGVYYVRSSDIESYKVVKL